MTPATGPTGVNYTIPVSCSGPGSTASIVIASPAVTTITASSDTVRHWLRPQAELALLAAAQAVLARAAS